MNLHTPFALSLGSALLGLLSVVPPASLGAQEASSGRRPPFRVLLVPEGEGVDLDRARLACDELERGIGAAGMSVVDRRQAELLASKGREMLGSWLGSEQNADVRLGTLAYADLVVRISVATVRERKVQGRYQSRLRGSFRTVFTDGAEIVGSGEAQGSGLSFDSYGEAHRAAIAALCDATKAESLGEKVIGGLQKAREMEREGGARVTVGIYVEGKLLKLLTPMQQAVASAEGVVPGSVQPLRNFAGGPSASGSSNTALELGLRCRGDVFALQGALMKALDEMSPEIEEEFGLSLAPTFIATGRRIDMVVKAVEAPTVLAEDVNRVIQDAVASAWSRNQHLLEGKRMSVLPASIAAASNESKDFRAFQRGFRTVVDSVEKQLAESGKPDADPLVVEGPFEISGESFPSLAAAKSKLMQLEEDFYESTGGQLATQLSDSVAEWFKEISEGKAEVLPTSRDRNRAIDVIKAEAEAAQQEGAVDETTIGFFQQEGTEVLVTTTLRDYFDKWVVSVDLLDVNTGQSVQGMSSFHPRLTPKIAEKLGG